MKPALKQSHYIDKSDVVFICLWNLGLSFASCTSCTSAMHDITQLRGMCIIGKEEEEEGTNPVVNITRQLQFI